jgi:hypothetical protein
MTLYHHPRRHKYRVLHVVHNDKAYFYSQVKRWYGWRTCESVGDMGSTRVHRYEDFDTAIAYCRDLMRDEQPMIVVGNVQVKIVED